MSAARIHARRLAGAALFLFVLGLSLTHIRDFDTWWHLKTGQLIVEQGIPRADPFSYVLNGRSWVTMEWLSQALFFLLFHLGGAWALTGFKAALLAAGFLILWRLNPKDFEWSTCVLALSAWALRDYFVERPFIFDYFFLCALTAYFWDISWLDPPKSMRWVLPLGAALWANLHGGAAVLVPGLTGLAVAAQRVRERRVPLGPWAAVIGASILAMLVNPHGIGVFTQFWGTLTFAGRDLIREWHAPEYHYFGLYGLYLGVGLLCALKTFKRRPFAAAWVLAAAAASTRMERNIPIYILMASPVIVSSFPAMVAERRARNVAAVLIALFWAASASVSRRSYPPGRFGIGLDEPLSGAVAFLDEAQISGRMFNEYESGGYLIWKGYPRRKVFIDGRSLEYGPEAVKLAMTWYQPRVWEALDSKWNFDCALIQRNILGAYTARVLEESPLWAPVYWDDYAMVYLRRTPEHEALLRRYQYRLLRPGRAISQYLDPYLQDPAQARVLAAELERSVSEARASCVNAWLLKSYVSARLKRWEEALQAARRAVELSSGRAQSHFSLGWVLESAGQWESAEAEYRQAEAVLTAAEKKGLGADILNNLGRLQERRGDLSGARESYQASLRLNPQQGDAWRNLHRIR